MKEVVLAHHTTMQIGASIFGNPTLSFLYDYWDSKRRGRQMPARKDINPSDFRQHLSWIFLADVLPEMQDFRYRLVGNLVANYFGLNGTNQTLRQVFAAFDQETMDGTLFIYRTVAREKVPVRVTGKANWNGKGLEEFETVYLPLSDDGETTNMILSAFVFNREAVLLNRAVAAENGRARVGT